MSLVPDCIFLERDADILNLRPDWQELQSVAGNADLLLSYPWYAAWRQVFGTGIRNGVITMRRGPRLMAVMPIMIGRVWRSPSLTVRHDYMPGDERFLTRRSAARIVPVRQLSPVLGLEATAWRGGLLAAPSDEAVCHQALIYFLRQFSPWDVAVMPLPGRAAESLSAMSLESGLPARIDRLDRPMYQRRHLPPWSVFLREKQHHFRKRYDEAIKRARRDGLTFRTMEGPDEIALGLDILADVAARSWKSGGREGEAANVPHTPASRSFFETLCRGGDAGVIPVISVIYRGMDAMAVLLSAAYGARLVTLQMFYDPAIRHVSVGRLLIKMTYEWAVERGMTEIDFNSNNDFARTFADDHDIHHNLILFKGSLYGRCLHALSQAWRGRVTSGKGEARAELSTHAEP